MEKEMRSKVFDEILSYFPKSISSILLRLPSKLKSSATEIRLRAGRPLSLTVGSDNVFISSFGEPCYLMQKGLYMVSEDELKTSFNNMCDCSVYAFKDQIKAGYISLKYGCRAGIAATAVYENGTVSGFKSISSIGVRLSVEYIGCANCLSEYLEGGLLIAGPPASGKTTLLRDAIRMISYGNNALRRRVAVVDTRGEICAIHNSIPQNDIGPLTDVITSCEKATGIEIALRTLNPQVIAFDEISTHHEAKAVSIGFFSGVDIITTAHAGHQSELAKRAPVVTLLENGAIKNIAFISKVGAVPIIYRVIALNGKLQLLEEGQGVLID